jgi:hypothetical protein
MVTPTPSGAAPGRRQITQKDAQNFVQNHNEKFSKTQK